MVWTRPPPESKKRQKTRLMVPVGNPGSRGYWGGRTPLCGIPHVAGAATRVAARLAATNHQAPAAVMANAPPASGTTGKAVASSLAAESKGTAAATVPPPVSISRASVS